MKKRIISAIVMILIVVPLIYFGDVEYKIFITALSLCGLWELFRLEENVPRYVRYLFYLFDGCLMFYKDIINDYIILIPLLSLLIILLSLSNIKIDSKRFALETLLKCMALSFINIFLFYSLVNLRDVGLIETIYVFLVATFTDTFALLGGKYFGKHKLCPSISPNKTIEGSISGTIFGTIIGMVIYLCFGPDVNGGILLLVTFILSIACQLGDLFFSSIKRFYKVKDFSNLIPGHGGILDRFDGILFVASLFMLLVKFL